MTAIADMLPGLFAEHEEILAPRRRVPLAEWAEQNRYVTSGPVIGPSGTPVRWSNDLDPLGVAVMAAVEDRRWSIVCLMGSPQRSGKTELAVNVICSILHQQQANVFYHNASAVAAMDVWRKKLRPAVEHSPELQHLVPEDREEGGTKDRRDFANGASLFMRGSESRAALAQATAMVTIADDVQAMLALPDGDHPVDLGMERADAYPVDQRIHLHLGQPGVMSDYLSCELFASTFYVPFVPCVKCSTYQLLEWDRFDFDRSDARVAWRTTTMRCAHPGCDHAIRDADLPEMLSRHAWVSTPPETNWLKHPMEGGTRVDLDEVAVYPETQRKTTVCGFWRSALYWPFTDWGETAVKHIEAEGNPEKGINFRKRILAIPWEEPKLDANALEPEDIYAHADDGHRWGTIPAEAGVQAGDGVVLCSVDVQAGHIWYLVEAWHKPTGSAWVIECGRFGGKIDTKEHPSKHERLRVAKSQVEQQLDKLFAKCAEGWPAIGGGGVLLGTFGPLRAAVDCRYLRDVVQRWCRLRNGGRWVGRWLPVSGSTSMARSGVPVWPGLAGYSKEKKSKRVYWESNTNLAKLHVREILAQPPGQPGSLVLPADMPVQCREWFAAHLCAEIWIEKQGTWRQESGENHLLDCQAMQVALALASGVKLLTVEAEAPKTRPAPAKPAPAPPRPALPRRAPMKRRPPVRRSYGS